MLLHLHRACSQSARPLLHSWTRTALRPRKFVQPARRAPGARDAPGSGGSTLLLFAGSFVSAKGLAEQITFDLPSPRQSRPVPEEAPEEQPLPKECAESAFTWARLWELIRPHLVYLLGSIASSFVLAYLNIRIPASLGEITEVISKAASAASTDAGQAGHRFTEQIFGPASRLLSAYLLQAFFTFTTIACLSTLGERLAASLRVQLFSTVLTQDAEFFDRHRSGELLGRITTDVQEFKSSFKQCVSQGLRSITQVLGCAVSLYLTSPELALGMLVLVPSAVGIGSLLGSLLRSASRACQQQQTLCAATAGEAISNVRTVKMFAMEPAERRLFAEQSAECGRQCSRLGLGIGAFQAATNLALNALIGCTLLCGGMLISERNLKPGELMTFLVAAQTIQRSLASFSLMLGQYVKWVASGERIFTCLALRPTIVQPSDGGVQCQPLVGDVRFRRVSFAYPTRPDQPVLDEFSLRLEAGKVTAVCGLSGAGKSTLALLLERFYDVQAGGVYVDETDVRQLDLRWLRGRAIGYINQEPTLFAGSILENIRYAKPEATDDEVVEAAKRANAHDFVQAFPSGYDTVVGERGASLSGGQRQRIAIARAILKDPVILILDEATSALDAESEAIIGESLEQMMRGRTVLIIAHRLSTIRKADVIAVMNQGRVVEQGQHEDLVRKKGLYWNLIRQQYGGSSP